MSNPAKSINPFHKHVKNTVSATIIIITAVSSLSFSESKSPQPPVAQKIEKVLIQHGHKRVDPYYWLNQRNNPEVIALLKAENRYKTEILKSTEPLQQQLFSEIVGRIQKSDQSVPYKSNGYYYYRRYEGKSEYPLYCRKKGSMESAEEILLDVNEMSRGYDYYHVTEPQPSPDGRWIAYGVDTVSRRKYTIYFKNLENGRISTESLVNTTGSVAWAKDSRTVFYTVKDDTLRPSTIFRHRLGTSPKTDYQIYHEADPTFNSYAFTTRSDDFIFIVSFHTLATEYRFLDATNPEGKFQLLQKREKNHEYYVDHLENHFYIRTNWRAKNFRLMKTAVVTPGKEDWQEVVPHRDGVLLEDLEVFADFLVLDERRDGLTRFRVKELNSSRDHLINLEEAVYTAYFSTNPETDTPLLRFTYSSLTTPSSTYDYNMKTREKILLKRDTVLGDFSPDDYHSERLYALSRDQVRIPISLVYRKDLKKESGNPLLLYGYGSYGASSDPYFKSDRISLLDRGFIFAIAHVRGGQEMGRDWYENGKLLKKKNTFFDFIDCADYLIKEKYTQPERLFAMGGSAGGLLMGAVANMRPEMFRGIIAAVPWVDVVTTMLDDSIPLTTAEFDEWGDPEVKEYYEYMLSYSPYDNVKKQAYPSMLVTTGYHDSQVQYFEPLKWVQKLREHNTSDSLIVMHINMEGGHGGVSGRFRKYRETALEYAFLISRLSQD